MNTLANRLITILCLFSFFTTTHMYAWGFYGHKLINQQAVYSLPLPLQQYFIKHVDFLSRHAVDPDKRRYAMKEEAFQHFFDTELWENHINVNEPHSRRDLLWSQPGLKLINGLDTTWIYQSDTLFPRLFDSIGFSFTGSVWDCAYGEVHDTMAQHGILPLTLHKWYKKLVRAFEGKEMDYILKISADLGHYIGDAHVPLHTTKNYNGQLTNQIGIHAFWETHVPEWLAEREFDFIVGVGEYIPDIFSTCWSIVGESHMLVDSVLTIEREVRAEVPENLHECARQRAQNVIHLPCPELLEAYHNRLNRMVEKQMRKSIKMIASFWWSAYIEAGQPLLGEQDMDEMINSENGQEAQSGSHERRLKN